MKQASDQPPRPSENSMAEGISYLKQSINQPNPDWSCSLKTSSQKLRSSKPSKNVKKNRND